MRKFNFMNRKNRFVRENLFSQIHKNLDTSFSEFIQISILKLIFTNFKKSWPFSSRVYRYNEYFLLFLYHFDSNFANLENGLGIKSNVFTCDFRMLCCSRNGMFSCLHMFVECFHVNFIICYCCHQSNK